MAKNKEREQLKALYPSPQWARKVDRMKDDQVAAIYLRLKGQGKI